MFRNFSLKDVQLKDDDFAPRRELAKKYIQDFDVDRLMHTFRKNAGINSQVKPLGGWESENIGLRGHFVGHYLSACAKYAYSDQDEVLKQKSMQIVDILEQCAFDNGYLSAFPEEILDRLEIEENREIWAPYYTLDKILKGLVECYHYLRYEKALNLAVNLAYYIYRRFEKLSYWKIDGILRCTKVNPQNEFGGIGDTLYQLYDITADSKILETAQLFDRDYFISPLADGKDVLENLHANTHLPMILSAMHRYNITKEEQYKKASIHFYDFVLGRTFANGNNSSKATAYIKGGVSEKSEHWGGYDSLLDALTGGESESCCAHNMEKIAQQLFEWTKDVAYLDHIEALKYNAVLNSTSSITGLSQYHQPMGTNVSKKFSTPYDSFWCCTASGIEAMSELQKNIWFKSEDAILVNMFTASNVFWAEKDVYIKLRTQFPDEKCAFFTIQTPNPTIFTLYFKAWAVKQIKINGVLVDLCKENDYVIIHREFRDNDRLEVEINADLQLLQLKGDPNFQALLYGKILMACSGAYQKLNLGNSEDLEERFQKGKQGPLEFRYIHEEQSSSLFLPLFRIEEEMYTVYMNLNQQYEYCQDFETAKDGSSAYQN
jgi:uncharacterized protein